MLPKKRVVITGIGAITPIGIGKENYRNSLRAGKSGVGRVSFFDVTTYPSQVDAEVKDFHPEEYIDKKKIRHMDRFVQFGFSAAKMAIEDSGLVLESEDLSRIGVIIASGIGGLKTIEDEHIKLLQKGERWVTPYLIPMLLINIIGGEVAIHYGLTGPNYSVASACASANHAIGNAFRLICYGDADIVLAGGSEAAITPLGFAGFCNIRSLSGRNNQPEKASRPFDRERDGFVMAEGAGIIVLEKLEHALKRGAHIYAELCGYGATDDAYHITAPHPDAEAAARAMQIALKDAGIEPQMVDYINAHGTSTKLNDKIETKAIKKVFGKRAYQIPISSTKSMTGHLLGAAGAVELIATLLSMETGFIHPTINYEFPDPECDLDYVPNQARQSKINCALSNSLGFGGHNAVLLVRRYS